MSSGQSARLVHRYAIRLSDRQLHELRRAADACEVPISVLLRVAIRWVTSAGPTALDVVPRADREDSTVDAAGALEPASGADR